MIRHNLRVAWHWLDWVWYMGVFRWPAKVVSWVVGDRRSWWRPIGGAGMGLMVLSQLMEVRDYVYEARHMSAFLTVLVTVLVAISVREINRWRDMVADAVDRGADAMPIELLKLVYWRCLVWTVLVAVMPFDLAGDYELSDRLYDAGIALWSLTLYAVHVDGPKRGLPDLAKSGWDKLKRNAKELAPSPVPAPIGL